MIRTFLPLSVGAGLLLAWATTAQAKSFTVTSITLKERSDGGTLQESERNEFFNRARCICQTSVFVDFGLSIDQSGESKPVTAVAGVGDCLTNEGDIDCTEPKPFPLANMNNALTDVEAVFPANQLMDDVNCTEQDDDEVSLRIFFREADDWQPLASAEAKYRRDIQPPNPPTKSEDPRGGDQRVAVSFTVASDTKEDTRYYQVLCVEMSEDGTQVNGPWGGAAPSPAFLTAEGLCGKADPQTDGPTSGQTSGTDAPDAGVWADAGAATVADAGADGTTGSESANASTAEPTWPPGLLNHSNNPYLCSERLAVDGSHAIEGLTNGKTYGFWVVAIDLAQNPSQPRWLGTGTPLDVEDLWELYSRLGGKAEGGYGCALTANGDWVGFGLLGLTAFGFLLARGTRRRRRRTLRARGGQQ